MTPYSPPVQSPLVRKLLNGEMTYTVEISPPVAGSKEPLLAQVERLKPYIDAVNITDAIGANVSMSNIAAAAILINNDYDVILQLNCRDQNRIGLMNDLLGAAALGIHNIIAVRGDNPEAGDHPNAKGVFDLKSHELVRTAHEMTTNGIVPARTMKMATGSVQANAKSIIDPPQFFTGTIDVPSLAGDDVWASRIHKRVAAGLQFIQTQACYDLNLVRRYLDVLVDQGLSESLFVIVSNSPQISVQSALWVKENIWGAEIPDDIVDRLKGAKDAREEGIKICQEQVEELLTIPGIAGINLIERENVESIEEVLKTL
ncbi:MAG: methylenetetrahydrofolate reductase [Rhodospirillaceae bacterium]|nr:methylenetetrahydrofolate reductase [Rhodospirillaceae bacterium]MBT7268164.1 methylenetetrahydrofolate reductase [Rhodospirillaceae bacterium]